jgi:hypothetical protein
MPVASAFKAGTWHKEASLNDVYVCELMIEWMSEFMKG